MELAGIYDKGVLMLPPLCSSGLDSPNHYVSMHYCWVFSHCVSLLLVSLMAHSIGPSIQHFPCKGQQTFLLVYYLLEAILRSSSSMNKEHCFITSHKNNLFCLISSALSGMDWPQFRTGIFSRLPRGTKDETQFQIPPIFPHPYLQPLYQRFH